MPKSKCLIRDKEILQEASDHLSYELNMLFFTANGLKTKFTKNPVMCNALLESFLVHARNLVDFFYNDHPKQDDIVAINFFHSPEQWEKIKSEESGLLKETKKRANKHLAHLTYERIGFRKESEKWEYEAIEKDIKCVLKNFLENVDHDFLGHQILNLSFFI